MSDTGQASGSAYKGRGPTLFFVILGLIVALIAAFLVLRPGGAEGLKSEQASPPSPVAAPRGTTQPESYCGAAVTASLAFGASGSTLKS